LKILIFLISGEKDEGAREKEKGDVDNMKEVIDELMVGMIDWF
jgi:hypothetical protein